MTGVWKKLPRSYLELRFYAAHDAVQWNGPRSALSIIEAVNRSAPCGGMRIIHARSYLRTVHVGSANVCVQLASSCSEPFEPLGLVAVPALASENIEQMILDLLEKTRDRVLSGHAERLHSCPASEREWNYDLLAASNRLLNVALDLHTSDFVLRQFIVSFEFDQKMARHLKTAEL